MLEIIIGSSNNTRSAIRRNQEDRNVVTMPTSRILGSNQWNDFRITWANRNILVFQGNEQFPFMTFAMTDFFPVGFYGLQSV
jgi:HKD family nuclease